MYQHSAAAISHSVHLYVHNVRLTQEPLGLEIFATFKSDCISFSLDILFHACAGFINCSAQNDVLAYDAVMQEAEHHTQTAQHVDHADL